MAIADNILRRMRRKGRGSVFTAADLGDLNGRASINQALASLAATGTIRRLDRGVYDLPVVHPVVGALWPSADAVAEAVARQTGSHIKGSGPMAANALGLTTQVPAHATYLTDGRSRTVQVGNLVVEIRHAGVVDMLLPGTLAGLVITALRHLGRDAASPATLQRLSVQLDPEDKRRLRGVRKKLRGWLRQAVEQIAAG